MSRTNKAVLEAANEAIRALDIEAFLAFCTDDIVWTAMGEQSLHGKAAVRGWMEENYIEAPRFTVIELIGENDMVAALGVIDAADDQGRPVRHDYCDVWRFRDGKMAELRAFVVVSAQR